MKLTVYNRTELLVPASEFGLEDDKSPATRQAQAPRHRAARATEKSI